MDCKALRNISLHGGPILSRVDKALPTNTVCKVDSQSSYC